MREDLWMAKLKKKVVWYEIVLTPKTIHFWQLYMCIIGLDKTALFSNNLQIKKCLYNRPTL